MVRYYGRARQRIGAVNTNQLGLKMSGCPSKVGLNPVNNRYIQQRVSCMRGICGIPKVHGVDWRKEMRNAHPYCAEPSSKCLAAAGGIGNIYTPYFKTVQPGKEGCTNTAQFGHYPPNLNVDPVGLQANQFPWGAAPTQNPDGSLTIKHGSDDITLTAGAETQIQVRSYGRHHHHHQLVLSHKFGNRHLKYYFYRTPEDGLRGRIYKLEKESVAAGRNVLHLFRFLHRRPFGKRRRLGR